MTDESVACVAVIVTDCAVVTTGAVYVVDIVDTDVDRDPPPVRDHVSLSFISPGMTVAVIKSV